MGLIDISLIFKILINHVITNYLNLLTTYMNIIN
jgi:hypothetical protein